MQYWNSAGVVFCTLFVVSCALQKPSYQEIQLPPARIAQKGYSFVPLNEKGWLVGGRNPTQLVLGKHAENPDETFVIHSALAKIGPYKTNEDFIRLIRDSQIRDTDTRRHKILRHDVVDYAGKATECARSELTSEDNAAVRSSGNKGVMILEVHTLACAHPNDKGVSVVIGFSQRYYAGRRDPAFVDKANAVLGSLEFSGL